MEEEEQNEEGGFQPEIIIQPEQLAGVWANFAAVSHSPYEFTLDFVRLDFRSQPPSGIVVSRVSLSPRFIDELIQALQTNWQKYVERAMPQEVYRDERSEVSGTGEEEPPKATTEPDHDDDDSSKP